MPKSKRQNLVSFNSAHTRSKVIRIMAVTAVLGIAQAGRADSAAWNAGGAGYWGLASNWTPQLIPSDVGEAATFGAGAAGPVILADSTGFDASFTVGSLLFNSTYAITNVSGGLGVIGIDNGAAAGVIQMYGGGGVVQSIDPDLVLSSDLSIFSRGSGTRTITGDITDGTNATTGDPVSAAVRFIPGTSGSYGTPAVMLNGKSSYTGATSIEASTDNTPTLHDGATVTLGGSDRLPIATALTLGGSAFTSATNYKGATLDLHGNSQTVGSLTAVATAGDAARITNNSATASSSRISVVGNTTSSFAGLILDGGVGKTVGVTTDTLARLTLSGNNTYSGTTQVLGGSALTVAGVTSGQGSYFVTGPSSLLNGTGTIGLGVGNSVSLTGVNSTSLAILSPGLAGAGQLRVNGGDVVFGNNSELASTLGATAGLTTTLTLTGGTIDLTSLSNKLEITQPSGGLGGTYVLASWLTPRSNYGIFENVTYNGGSLSGYAISYNTTSIVLSAVPEPTMGLVFAGAFLGLLKRRHRQSV